MFICHDTVCNNHLPAPTLKHYTHCHFDERACCFDSFLIFCLREMFTKLVQSAMLLKCVWFAFKFFHNVGFKAAKDIFNPADCVACLKTCQFNHRKKTLQPINIRPSMFDNKRKCAFATQSVFLPFCLYKLVIFIDLFTRWKKQNKYNAPPLVLTADRRGIQDAGIHAHCSHGNLMYAAHLL